MVKGTRNLFFSDFLVQLQRAATLYGYNGIVSYLDENANEIDAAEKILREIKPDVYKRQVSYWPEAAVTTVTGTPVSLVYSAYMPC